jgi:ABC-type Fe2+-enterobactin transport system substrate-binding protein
MIRLLQFVRMACPAALRGQPCEVTCQEVSLSLSNICIHKLSAVNRRNVEAVGTDVMHIDTISERSSSLLV